LEKQSSMMTVQSEMIDEQMDSVFEEDNDDETPDEVVAQVMEEAGVVLPSAMTEIMFVQQLEALKPSKAT